MKQSIVYLAEMRNEKGSFISKTGGMTSNPNFAFRFGTRRECKQVIDERGEWQTLMPSKYHFIATAPIGLQIEALR